MNRILCACVCLLLNLTLGADGVRGSYDLREGLRLMLSEKGHAVVKRSEAYVFYGAWEVSPIGKRECAVVKLWEEHDWQVECPSQIIIFDILEKGKRLHVIGVSDTSLEEAIKSIEKLADDPERPLPYVQLAATLNAKEEEEIAEAISRVDAPVKERKAKERLAEAGNRLQKDTKLLRKVKFKYPELDPEESVPDARSLPALYPKEMQVVFDILWKKDNSIDKDTLENMLERVDWERGDVLAFMILRRPELDAAALHKYAPKAMSRIGKTDHRFLQWYFGREDLPREVLAEAKEKGYEKD